MPFEMVRNDITKMKVDAVVNAANQSLLGGGGVDGAIHRAAGPELLEECRALGGCRTGQAKITKGYRLPAGYVIHTVGPIWHGGLFGEQAQLRACYRNSLELALEHGCESVAFPLISAGAYGYPKDKAISVAVDEIRRFLADHDMTVYLVLFGPTEFLTGKKLYRQVKEYIDDLYVEERVDTQYNIQRRHLWQTDPEKALKQDIALTQKPTGSQREARADIDAAPAAARPRKTEDRVELSGYMPPEEAVRPKKAAGAPRKPTAQLELFAAPMAAEPDWNEILRRTDEGFSAALLRLIDEKGMTDAQCYKRANIDRKLFSKIRSNPEYKPSKPTVFAFAVALRLSLPETTDLLRRAGYALSHSSKFDIILEYFIINRRFDVFEINEVLFQFDMPLLGSIMC